mgnify:CR=1 FL=1|tara:strand:- start:141 stop:428 length:288 start_codon:yes stop_codon:yes gene_type:complete
MNLKKITINIFLLSLLCGCAQNTAVLGPVYTFVTTGSAYQASLSYGSDRAISSLTGKSPTENIKEIFSSKKKDSEFEKLVKKNIEETRKKLNLSN